MPKSTKEKRPQARKERQPIALVTGGTSGIGRMIVEELLKRNYEVRVILKAHPNKDSEWKALPGGAKVYAADISVTGEETKKTLLEACKGVKVLFHLAAAVSNASNTYNKLVNTNVVGTENILRAYFDANPDPDTKLKFIYSSSVTVYGYKRSGETLTEESETMPQSAYSESKYMGEQIIKAFAEANGRLDYTIFRIGVLYGKGYEHSFMHIFKLIKEKKIRYVGKGMNYLTLINIDDAVEAMIMALGNSKSRNRTFNLTDGVNYTQKDLIKKAAELLNEKEPTKSIHPILARIGARTRGINIDQFRFLVSDRKVSIEKIKKELGFRPHVSIDQGGKLLVKDFIKKYKSQ